MMHPKTEKAAIIKSSLQRHTWLRYALPIGGITLCLSLLVGQKFLRSQSRLEIAPPPQLTPPPASQPDWLKTPSPWEQLAAQSKAQPLPPDLFTNSKSPATMPAAPTATRQPSTQLPPAAAAPLPRQVPVAVMPTKGPSPEIRVAIARGAQSLPLGTSTQGYLVDDSGTALTTLAANQAQVLQADGQGMVIGQVRTPASVWLQPTAGGLLYVDGRWYRGKLRLINEGGSLLAVNQVNLEEYVACVVGAEVYPSWPMAALKAQAIAARSYALAQSFRPASQFFDLGNNQRWQVYQGVEDEWNTTVKAVNDTRGVVLSKDGSVLVSMYAATDDIVRDAFGGRGMSQNGAFRLAQQGFDYLQILGTYYPGAGLSQIRIQ